ncbi:UDP-glycosyltransferase 88F3-like [Lolium rigidum]|uniref:UDP-glycosyltransferase 88F3-like n=1 Tax=Lolium rigidum TaxID=89674 RepID=UPI001F5D83BB|nr:UDP-glycosyltransferase 88F3-like [Lolium rigidum]
MVQCLEASITSSTTPATRGGSDVGGVDGSRMVDLQLARKNATRVRGLPMICWPLYAEQGLNKVLMVEEIERIMKIAVALRGYKQGMVKAEEVEAKVRLVMETGEGTKLRETLAVARKMAVDAIGADGSSEVAFAEFMMDLENSVDQAV